MKLYAIAALTFHFSFNLQNTAVFTRAFTPTTPKSLKSILASNSHLVNRMGSLESLYSRTLSSKSLMNNNASSYMSTEEGSITTSELTKAVRPPQKQRRQVVQVPVTVADLFQSPPSLALFYHSVGTAYDTTITMGALGGALSKPLFFSTSSSLSTLQAAANGSLIVSFSAMAIGALYFAATALTQSNIVGNHNELQTNAEFLQWNKNGRLDRRHRLGQNGFVRLLDCGTWAGCAGGGIAMMSLGGPVAMGLNGGTLGTLQALSLGTAVGSTLSIAYYYFRWSQLQSSEN